MTIPEIEETAKATQEVAKTAGKAIDATRELGGFFSRIFGGPLTQLVGIGEDHLTAYRLTRQLRLAKRYAEIRSELGLDGKTKVVELKFGLPLIAAASIENDDTLQDLYARLLITATDPTSKIQARRAFVSILQDLARRMGGAKRYPSMYGGEGFRNGLNPSYLLEDYH
ncbi:hypothetical protein [Bradyrhizobium sp.]|uniref:Abi-alpha family protein n=1 Tax=Bradyrhizobium sp. TaxID=376 RepID=UPI003C743368